MAPGMESKYQNDQRRYAARTGEEKIIINKRQTELLNKRKENEEFLKKYKEGHKRYSAQIRQINMERGLCVSCSLEKEDHNFTQCTGCREKNKIASKKYRLKMMVSQ